MKHSVDKIALGIIGEKFIVNCLDRILGKRKQRGEYRIKHNKFKRSEYPMGSGLDIQVFRDDKPLIDCEVKNWNYFDKPYGIEFAKTILDRFIGSVAPIKILFISYVSLLTHTLIDLIKLWGITIIEIGTAIQPNQSWGKYLRKFHIKYRYKLRKLLKQSQKMPKKSLGFNSTLINYSRPDSNHSIHSYIEYIHSKQLHLLKEEYYDTYIGINEDNANRLKSDREYG